MAPKATSTSISDSVVQCLSPSKCSVHGTAESLAHENTARSKGQNLVGKMFKYTHTPNKPG